MGFLSFSPTEVAFLAAVRAAPRDDAPRLVYADWLEENGDADCAEYIRLSCRPAAGPGEPPAAPVGRTMRALFRRVKDRWIGVRDLTYYRIPPGHLHFQGFDRGMPVFAHSTANYPDSAAVLDAALAGVAAHHQLRVHLGVHLRSAFDPVPLLSHDIFARAQWVDVTALCVEHRFDRTAPVPDRVVAAAVAALRGRPLAGVAFGPLSDSARQWVTAGLAPHFPTTVSGELVEPPPAV